MGLIFHIGRHMRMQNSIIEKLDAIERLVRDIRREIFLNTDSIVDSAPIRDEIFAHTITLFYNNEEEIEYNLDDMDIKELKGIAGELEIDLPKDAYKEDVIFAIMELYREQASRK